MRHTRATVLFLFLLVTVAHARLGETDQAVLQVKGTDCKGTFLAPARVKSHRKGFLWLKKEHNVLPSCQNIRPTGARKCENYVGVHSKGHTDADAIYRCKNRHDGITTPTRKRGTCAEGPSCADNAGLTRLRAMMAGPKFRFQAQITQLLDQPGINLKGWTIGRKIGGGQYGGAYLATKDSKTYVAKICSNPASKSCSHETLFEEAVMQESAEHHLEEIKSATPAPTTQAVPISIPKVIKFGTVNRKTAPTYAGDYHGPPLPNKGDQFIMIMEKAEGESLEHMVEARRGASLDTLDAPYHIRQQLKEFLTSLREKTFIQPGDVNAGNVILSIAGTVIKKMTLIDFGSFQLDASKKERTTIAQSFDHLGRFWKLPNEPFSEWCNLPLFECAETDQHPQGQ